MKNTYVYIYLDPRKSGFWAFKNHTFNFQPFYVGVGKGKRIYSHLYSNMLKVKSMKSSKILAIQNQGLQPLKYKIFENLDSKTAYELEKEIINHFGRVDKNTGILCNHTDGGIGWNKTKVYNKTKILKTYFRYNLEGDFVVAFTSLDLSKEGIKVANISTAIKRNGTYLNSRWFYENQGLTITPQIKYQQSYGFSSIEKVQIKNLYLTGNSLEEIKNKLNTSKEKIVKELKFQKIYKKEKNSHKILQLDLNNNVIKIWEKAFQIEKELRYSSSAILACCKEKRKTYKKFKWKYYVKTLHCDAKNEIQL